MRLASPADPVSVFEAWGYERPPTGEEMAAMTRRLRKRLSGQFTLTCIDGPHTVPSHTPPNDGCAWWTVEKEVFDADRASSGEWLYRGVEASLEAVREANARDSHGGFDGVFGFSQGGALVSLLAALAQHRPESAPLPNLRCAAFAGAFQFGAKEHSIAYSNSRAEQT